MDRETSKISLGLSQSRNQVSKQAISRSQRQALTKLAPIVAAQKMYLAGGVGIALRLGHRCSRDLDFFSTQAIADPLQLAALIQAKGVKFKTTSTAPGTLYGQIGKLPVSFIEYRYAPLTRLQSVEGVRVASIRDLAAMKISAIADRGAKKDFIDIYFMLEKISLSKMIAAYRDRFNTEDISHVVMALIYFDEADKERTPKMIRAFSWPKLKSTFRDAVRKLR